MSKIKSYQNIYQTPNYKEYLRLIRDPVVLRHCRHYGFKLVQIYDFQSDMLVITDTKYLPYCIQHYNFTSYCVRGTKISDDDIKLIFLHIHRKNLRLRKLDLSECFNVTDTTLSLIARFGGCEQLNLTGCFQITVEGVSRLPNVGILKLK